VASGHHLRVVLVDLDGDMMRFAVSGHPAEINEIQIRATAAERQGKARIIRTPGGRINVKPFSLNNGICSST